MCPETPLGPPFCSVGWWDGDGDEEGAAPSVPRSHSQSTGMGTPSRKTAQRQVRDLRDGIPEGARDSRWLWGQHGTDPRPAPLQHSPTCGFPGLGQALLSARDIPAGGIWEQGPGDAGGSDGKPGCSLLSWIQVPKQGGERGLCRQR